MSPLWPERLCIIVGPDQAGVAGAPDLERQELAESQSADAVTQANFPSWQLALQRLEGLLERQDWKGRKVEVVLSNRLVRHALVPFSTQLKTYPEQEAFARHVMVRTYGASAENWELRIQRGKANEPWLVSAISRELLDGLRRLCSGYKLELHGVRSYLEHILNGCYKRIAGSPAWLVIHESGYSCLALLDKGKLLSVSGEPHDHISDLPLMLERENLAGQQPEPCRLVYLYRASGATLTVPEGRNYEFKLLNPTSSKSLPFIAYKIVDQVLSGKRLQLDFQRQFVPRPGWASWLLLAAGMALLGEMGVSYGKLQNERDAIFQEMGASKMHMDTSLNSTSARKFVEQDFVDGRQIIGRLSTPWDELFTALESVANKDVAVLSLEPDRDAGVLLVSGEAKDIASILTFISQLRATKPFSRVLLSHNEVKKDDPQHPVLFTLSLHWRGES